MDVKELRLKDVAALQQLLSSTREELRDLRFRVHGGQLKDVRDVREAKRLVARIMTILKEKKGSPTV